MNVFHRGVACIATALLLGFMVSVCRGQASLSPSQQQQVAKIQELRAKAEGEWHNPNYDGIVRMSGVDLPPLKLLKAGATGSWRENRRNNEYVDHGTWSFQEGGVGTLAFARGGRVDALLGSGNLLALQPYTKAGGILGDGVVMFRKTFDFEGRDCKAVVVADGHKQSISGKWSHPNIGHVQEVSPDGMWVERRKVGGIHTQGIWEIQSDGSFFVNLENRWKFRVWTIARSRLAVLVFKPDGSLSGDGWLLWRE